MKLKRKYIKKTKNKTKNTVYDLTFIINEKEYHYIMVCHELDKNQNITCSQFTNPFEFSIELNPLQTREESKAMFRPMIENNEYSIEQITKPISYEDALKIAKQYKLKYMELCCSLNRNYNITNLDIKLPKKKLEKRTNVKQTIPKKLQNIKNPVLRETLIKRYLKQSQHTL